MSRSTTSTGTWGTSCAPSTRITAPTACAASASRRSGGNRAEDVRHAGDGDDLRPLGDETSATLEAVQVERAVLGERDEPQLRAGGLGGELPRHQVRMVLDLGQQDLVPFLKHLPGEAVRDEVGRLGRASGEDDRRGVGGADEPGQLLPRAFEQRRGLLGQRVHGAVDVRVVALVEVGQGVEDLPGLLAGGRGIQVDERPVAGRADPAFEDREVLADAFDVERSRSPVDHLGHSLSRPSGVVRFLGTTPARREAPRSPSAPARARAPAPRKHDPPAHHDVDVVGRDVVQDPLVVRDDQDTQRRADQLLHARSPRTSASRCPAPSRSRRGWRSAARARPAAAPRSSSSRRRRIPGSRSGGPSRPPRPASPSSPSCACGTRARWIFSPFTALYAVRRKFTTETPAISVGYWNARNRPSWARLSTESFVMSSPPNRISPAVTLYVGPAHQDVRQRGLARAVRAHERVDLALANTVRSMPLRISLPSTARVQAPDLQGRRGRRRRSIVASVVAIACLSSVVRQSFVARSVSRSRSGSRRPRPSPGTPPRDGSPAATAACPSRG